MLIFRSGKPQTLVSQPSLLPSHATWKEVFVRSISALFLSPRPLAVFFPSHVFRGLLFHLWAVPRRTLFLFRISRICLSRARASFHSFSFLLFFSFLSFVLFPFQAVFFSPQVLIPCRALQHRCCSSSSTAVSELSWAHVPPEKP